MHSGQGSQGPLFHTPMRALAHGHTQTHSCPLNTGKSSGKHPRPRGEQHCHLRPPLLPVLHQNLLTLVLSWGPELQHTEDWQPETKCYFRCFSLFLPVRADLKPVLLQAQTSSLEVRDVLWSCIISTPNKSTRTTLHCRSWHSSVRLYTLEQMEGTERWRHTGSECSDKLSWGKWAERTVGPQRGELTGGN